MATQPLPSSIVLAKSTPLYGIMVTERSYRIGMRSLAIQHQGNFLAHRVIGDRLPPELCDKIGTELNTLLEKDAAQVWEKMKHDPEARAARFRVRNANPMESELVGRRNFDLMSACETVEGTVRVFPVPVCVDLIGAAEGGEERYVHLSAALVRPSIAALVPPNLARHSGGPPLSLADGKMVVRDFPNSAHRPSTECMAVDMRTGEPSSAKRLIQFDDVEASIRTWNPKLVGSLVSRMGLRAVDGSGLEGTGGGMKPEFRILQKLEWY
jgi:hypothetical protein